MKSIVLYNTQHTLMKVHFIYSCLCLRHGHLSVGTKGSVLLMQNLLTPTLLSLSPSKKPSWFTRALSAILNKDNYPLHSQSENSAFKPFFMKGQAEMVLK